MLTTTIFGLKKPQTSDAPSALRTAISDNADLLDAALVARTTRWERLAVFSGRLGVASTRQYFVAGQPKGTGTLDSTSGSFNSQLHTIHVDHDGPAGLTGKLRLRFHWSTSATAPGVALTLAIFDASGTVLPGSGYTFTPSGATSSPASSSRETICSLPVPGSHDEAIIPAVTPAAATAAGSTVDFVVFIDRSYA